MKIASLFICVASLALIGCNADPHPAAGMAALVAKVVAEPKAGTAASPTHVAAYDGGDFNVGGTGDFERVDYSDLHDIVVWLESAHKMAVQPPSGSVGVELKSDGSPSGLSGVARVGQTIAFRNTGPRAVTAYSVSDGNAFNLGAIAPGGVAEAVAKSQGLIEIVSDSANEPLARIYAAPGGWVMLAQSGRSLVFNNVPPGRYRLVSWHPRLPGSAAEVELLPDRVSHSSIEVGVNHLPKISAK